jgi:tripartite-type tricarboxylate transporter receptor subunit TctC
VKKRFAALSLAPFPSNRQATTQYLRTEGSRWEQVIKTRGIHVEN